MGLRDIFQRSADRVKVRASRTMEGLSGIVVRPSIDEAIKKIEDRLVAPEEMVEMLRRIEAAEGRVAQVEIQSARALQEESARIAGLDDRLLALERELLEERRRVSRIVRQGIVAAILLAAGAILTWYITRPVIIP